MRYVEVPAPPRLAHAVRFLWWLEGDGGTGPAARQRVVPDGCPELILHYGAPYRLVTADGGTAGQARGAFVGQLEAALEIEPQGPTGILGVRFHPAGARDAAGVPMRELAGRSVGLRELWGPAGQRLVDRVVEARTASERARAVVEALLARVAAPRPADALADWAVGRLAASGGCDPIASVADAAGTSTRRLERAFAERVGLPPKRLARILRLQAALRALAIARRPDWAVLAARCGFADQAHLVREFRALTGLTPGEYASAEHPLHDFAS